jgi:hypothetical protein
MTGHVRNPNGTCSVRAKLCAVDFFLRRALGTAHYVCLASSRHPQLSGVLTMRGYLAEQHVLVAPESGHNLVKGAAPGARLHAQGRASRAAFRRAARAHRQHGSPAVAYSRHVRSSAHRRSLRSCLRVRELDVMPRWQEHSGDVGALRWSARPCETA